MVFFTKINTLINTEKNSCVSKVFFMFYQFVQVLTGFDFGFCHFKSLKVNYLTNVYSFMLIVSTCGIVLKYYVIDAIIESKFTWITFWVACFAIKYTSIAIIFIFIKPDKSYFGFYSEMQKIDSNLGINSCAFNVEIKILCTDLIFVIFRACNTIYHGFHMGGYNQPLIANIASFTPYVFTDIALVLYSFFFYSMKYRLKYLTSILEKTNSNYKSVNLAYKSYADFVDQFKETYDFLMVTNVLFKMPEIVVSIFNVLERFLHSEKSESEYLQLVFQYDTASIVEALVKCCAPAVCAGMLATQAQRMKIVLCDKLSQEKDETKAQSLERFINYIEARPCRFRVWKLIPLNADLVGMVFHFCVTYLIVIIQFVEAKPST